MVHIYTEYYNLVLYVTVIFYAYLCHAYNDNPIHCYYWPPPGNFLLLFVCMYDSCVYINYHHHNYFHVLYDFTLLLLYGVLCSLGYILVLIRIITLPLGYSIITGKHYEHKHCCQSPILLQLLCCN